MVFIGLRALKVYDEDGLLEETFTRKSKVIHFNPSFIKWVNENTMTICLDDGNKYRIDEESLLVFLSSMYGDIKKR
jgi:hypothetical protein